MQHTVQIFFLPVLADSSIKKNAAVEVLVWMRKWLMLVRKFSLARSRISKNNPEKSVSRDGRRISNTIVGILKRNYNICIVDFENKLF